MDMAAKFQDQTVFHMTGKRAGDGLAELSTGFRPALLAAYRDLTRLRYDYPVVLLERDVGRRLRAVAVIGGRRADHRDRTARHRRRTRCASSCCASSARSAR